VVVAARLPEQLASEWEAIPFLQHRHMLKNVEGDPVVPFDVEIAGNPDFPLHRRVEGIGHLGFPR